MASSRVLEGVSGVFSRGPCDLRQTLEQTIEQTVESIVQSIGRQRSMMNRPGGEAILGTPRSGAPILGAQSIFKSYGALPVLNGVSMTVHEGERIGLIGRNGAGKSTLLAILAGLEPPDEGLVTRRQGLRVRMLSQNCLLDLSKTVGQTLDAAGQEIRALLDEHDELTRRLSESEGDSLDHDQLRSREQLRGRYDDLHHELELAGAWDFAQEIDRVSIALDLAEANRVLGTLSGGELRRVDLAATIVSRPDVLLLDEPTNHIDTKSVEWIERYLAGYRGSCVLVTHDRYFLELVVTRIVEIDSGRLYSFPGNYRRFLEYKAQLDVAEAKHQQTRQATLRRELAWLQRGAKARTTKQKARIKRYEILEGQNPEFRHQLSFEIPKPPRLGKRVLETKDLSFSYGDKRLFTDFSIIVQKGMRIGVVGPNGCGKTTLVRVLMGREEPDSGEIFIGQATEFLYVDQAHEELDPDQSVLHFVSGGGHYWDVNDRRIYVPSYLERLLFDADSIHAPMGTLSGGERNRIELAKKLLQGGNFLILDEPTNDLDLHTLRVLEDAVDAFDGCAIVVSHDRYFLNRLCTHLIVFEGDGKLLFLAGNYDDYLVYLKKKSEDEAPADKPETKKARSDRRAPGPQRLTYKGKRELAGMEGAIEAAETELARYEAAVNEPGFYEQDYAEVEETLASLSAAKDEVERLYTRWQELEEKEKVT